jgi:hypothetical protein
MALAIRLAASDDSAEVGGILESVNLVVAENDVAELPFLSGTRSDNNAAVVDGAHFEAL